MPSSIYLKNKLEKFLRENFSGKKLLVINSYDKIGLIAEALHSASGFMKSGADILCFKACLPPELNSFKDMSRISEDYILDEDYDKIDNYVFKEISKSWDAEAAAAFSNIFTYGGISLAKIAEYDFQSFLIPRVKALAVVKRVLAKENYEAVFIMDSNDELNGLDRLIIKTYKIKSGFLKIKDRVSPREKVKELLASAISNILDKISMIFLRLKEGVSLIDARLSYQLKTNEDANFILVPFERGVRLRLRSLARGYVAFNFEGLYGPRGKYIGGFDFSCLENKFIFEGVNYWDLIGDRIRIVVGRHFARFRKNIDILHKTASKHKIKSIVLRNDLKELEKTIVLAAKTLKIPTLVIQHGILAEPNCSCLIYADKIAVWGDRDSKWYRDYGNDPDKISIAGSLNTDWMSMPVDAFRKDDFLAGLNISGKKRLATLISTGVNKLKLSSFTTDDVTENLIRAVIKAVKSMDDMMLIVKMHPNERAEKFKKLIPADGKDSIKVVDKINLKNLLMASDLIIAKESTVALDAVFLRKPVLTVNLTRRRDLVPYAERNVALGVRKAEDIAGAIKRIFSDEKLKSEMEFARSSFIKEFTYKTDGKSRERILKLIESL